MEVKVLFENNENGNWYGHSENYTPVFVVSQEELSNKIRTIRIKKSFKNNCEGELLKN